MTHHNLGHPKPRGLIVFSNLLYLLDLNDRLIKLKLAVYDVIILHKLYIFLLRFVLILFANIMKYKLKIGELFIKTNCYYHGSIIWLEEKP